MKKILFILLLISGKLFSQNTLPAAAKFIQNGFDWFHMQGSDTLFLIDNLQFVKLPSIVTSERPAHLANRLWWNEDSLKYEFSNGAAYFTLGTGGAGVSDHGALSGLTDDDHTQYVLLAGRSGGQIIKGGTGTTDDLVLQSTSGVGAAGADIIFKGGNNGATTFGTINNSGEWGIGGAPASTYRLAVSGAWRLDFDANNSVVGSGASTVITSNSSITIRYVSNSRRWDWIAGSDGIMRIAPFTGQIADPLVQMRDSAGNVLFQVATVAQLQTKQVFTALTSTVKNISTQIHNTSGTPAAGIGLSNTRQLENASGTLKTVYSDETVITTATANAEQADLIIKLMDRGVAVDEVVRIKSNNLIAIAGNTASFPALGRNGINLRATLADSSAATDLEVLDEVYDATNWNGSLEVPTKNAVRDKIESLSVGAGDFMHQAGQTNSVTVSNNAAETSIYGSFAGGVTISSSDVQAGGSIILTGSGFISTDATPGEVQFRFDVGDIGLDAGTFTGLTFAANMPYSYYLELTPRTIGAGATWAYEISVWCQNNGSPIELSGAGTITGDSNENLLCAVTVDWNTADPDNSVVAHKNKVVVQKPN